MAIATKSFGQRGLAPRATTPVRVARAPVAAPVATPAGDDDDEAPIRIAPADGEASETAKLLSLFPILTVGMVLFLTLIFLLEKKYAPDLRGNNLSLSSLVALGGASRKLIFVDGEWWRIFLAPLLHASGSHIIGNSIALAFVGTRLEPLLGRWWMCATFAIAALGGIAGSMIGNPPEVTTVGASGAITGLVAALFALSFHKRADKEAQTKMRRTALFFGVPALGPLLWGATGTTDYFAHFGGALGGLFVGLFIGIVWDGATFRPGFQKFAAGVTFVFLTLSAVSAAIAAKHFKVHAVEFSHTIPLSEMPATLSVTPAVANDLVARYPRDPRSHLMRAFSLAKDQKLLAAEQELNEARAHAHEMGPAKEAIEQVSTAMLALIWSYQGRKADAQKLAAPICAAKIDRSIGKGLVDAKLCK